MNQEMADLINRKRSAEPMRSYLWVIELPWLHSGSRWLHQEVSSRVLSVSTPFSTFTTEKEANGNTVWTYAKGDEVGQFTMEVMEHEDGGTFDYFDIWMKLIKNSNGTYNPPIRYKKDISFYRLNSFKSKIEKFTYVGYFPSGLSDLANDYESNNVVRYSVTLTGDSFHKEDIKTPGKSQKDLEDMIRGARANKKSLLEYLF